MKTKVIGIALIVLCLVLVISPGCVSKSKYDALVAENMESATENASLKAELHDTKNYLLELGAELEATKDNLSQLEASLQATEDNLLQVEAELEVTQAVLSAIETDQLHLHNPTFDEVLRFLAADITDSKTFIEGEYVCTHFGRDVNDAAETQGIKCAVVWICFPQKGHTIIGFNTVDKGMVYFEPQSDERVRPAIGKEFWQCIEPKPSYYYEKPSYDDTIVDIVIVW